MSSKLESESRKVKAIHLIHCVIAISSDVRSAASAVTCQKLTQRVKEQNKSLIISADFATMHRGGIEPPAGSITGYHYPIDAYDRRVFLINPIFFARVNRLALDVLLPFHKRRYSVCTIHPLCHSSNLPIFISESLILAFQLAPHHPRHDCEGKEII